MLCIFGLKLLTVNIFLVLFSLLKKVDLLSDPIVDRIDLIMLIESHGKCIQLHFKLF